MGYRYIGLAYTYNRKTLDLLFSMLMFISNNNAGYELKALKSEYCYVSLNYLSYHIFTLLA